MKILEIIKRNIKKHQEINELEYRVRTLLKEVENFDPSSVHPLAKDGYLKICLERVEEYSERLKELRAK